MDGVLTTMADTKNVKPILGQTPFNTHKISYKHHMVFWLVYFVFNTLRWGSYFDDYGYSFKANLIGFPIHMTLAYLNIYVLMPRFVFKKKYITYALLVVGSLYVMLQVKFNLTYYLVSTNVWPEGLGPIDKLTFNYSVQMMLGELYVISFVTAIKVTIDWLGEHAKLHDAERRQMETELRFLRSQISPHFFFNTLNNIYALSLKKSEKAPKVILKLSALMRYLLYATNKQKQSLSKEIECIQNYIELERMRFDESLEVQIAISGDLEGKEIPPMLLVPLIENSFKHGASQNLGPKKIELSINVDKTYIRFKLSNTMPEENGTKKTTDTAGGIGLKNVKKRLELGYNKLDYEFRTFKSANSYNVFLKLKIK